MIHLPQFITDLGLILTAAAVTTLVFKKIKQPVVLGYISAGLFVGSYFSFLPTVTDEKSIATWAEIGVIFLLFSLGLEFSFKKLIKVGGAASITAVVEALCMLGIGFLSGHFMGWSTMDSIFLGGVLSISSTTIIIRAFDELGVKHKKFATLVFGVLIVEDLIAILLLVLLTTLSISQQFAGHEILISILKLCFFLMLWFLSGIFLIPTFLKHTRKLMNDETMLIVSLALCLIMVILAVQAGFSAALGAFIMGSMLAETTQAERIEHLTKSVKDLFAAIFFVSVGMMINPVVLVEHIGSVLILTGVTILGKLISTAIGSLLSGQPLKTAVHAGMSLTQIGEFSFIIASLGLTLHVTSHFLYPIAVAVSAITTFTTPYLIQFADPLYGFLEKQLPSRWLSYLNGYTVNKQEDMVLSNWKIFLKSSVYNLIIHSVILIAITFLSNQYLHSFALKLFPAFYAKLVTLLVALVCMLPFLWAIFLRKIEQKAYSNLWVSKKYNRGLLIVFGLFRAGGAVFYLGFLSYTFLDSWMMVGIVVLGVVLIVVILSNPLEAIYKRIETRFFMNLNERKIISPSSNVLLWDVHVFHSSISGESPLVGKTLAELDIRRQYGVNIVLIERGKRIIATPKRDERLYPHDKLSIIGTDDQLAHIKQIIETPRNEDQDDSTLVSIQNIQLQKLHITNHSAMCNASIRTSGIREQTQALIVGVERKGERILNPSSSFVFELEDIVWIVGNRRHIKTFLHHQEEGK